MLPVSIRPAVDRGPARAFPGLALSVLIAAAASSLLSFLAGMAFEHHTDLRSRATIVVSVAQLTQRVARLESSAVGPPDWTAIARRAEPSIFTVGTSVDEGSGWVVDATVGGSDLVTNYHVVASAWTAGNPQVSVRGRDHVVQGTIVRVDQVDDLALIHIDSHERPLVMARDRPQLGAPIMAVGSPLGLGGSLSVGVVSGFRSLQGSDYMQFSAPISPGNSGGPVLDARGRVVAIASAKYAGEGVEALSLGIPLGTACTTLISC